MNTNVQYGYDKLLTKDEFYLEVIYPNLVKSAGILYYQGDYARARRSGNSIEDVINQAFYQAYKPIVRGGKYGKAGETMYDYYVENYFHVKNGDTQMVDDFRTDIITVTEIVDGTEVTKEVKTKVKIGEHEVLIRPVLNTIRCYMNTIVRNVLKDMCKVCENQKDLVSFDTPVGDEEDGRTLFDIIADVEDDSMSDSLKSLHYSVSDEFLINKYGNTVSVIDVLSFLESGSSVKEASDYYGLSEFDIYDFFKNNFTTLQECFEGVTDSSKNKLNQRFRRARKDLLNSNITEDYDVDKMRSFMLS